MPGYPAPGDVSTELVDTVLEGAATFSGEGLGPLNKVRVTSGTKRHDDGRVTVPAGFRWGVCLFVGRGWTASLRPELGWWSLPK